MKGKTSLSITHRIDTIEPEYIIHVLDRGVIEEKGTKEELLKFKGFFSTLYRGSIQK